MAWHTGTCILRVALNDAVNMPSIPLFAGTAMLWSKGQKSDKQGIWRLGYGL